MRIPLLLTLIAAAAQLHAAEPATPATNTLRVAAVQARPRAVDFRLKTDATLAAVEANLEELERIIERAGREKCDALAFPEDTLGLLNWSGVNETALKDVLTQAVPRMLDRLGRAAAKHRMYLVVCSDFVEADGGIYNTSFLLGRDGKEIGRYHKTCPTWSECGVRQRGDSFPVFNTQDLGTVGMLICYDLVIPETARCLALQGADIIFFPTMGGAAIGDDDIGVQALRVRAVENFIYLVVAHRGSGAMIISPQGKILSKAEGPDGLAIADIDPRGGREGGDSSNRQRDMRARLFRERNPAAFSLLTDPNPPVLAKVPIDMTSQEAGRIMAHMLTVGDEEFKQANALQRAGKTNEAIAAFKKLRTEYRGSWIDRASAERLTTLHPEPRLSETVGIASAYPGDRGIERDPRVLFAENFESGNLAEMGRRWGNLRKPENLLLTNDTPAVSAGQRALRIAYEGHLYTHFRPADRVFARYYIKFHPKCGYTHHLPFLLADREPTPWPKGFAGKKPDGGDFFGTAVDAGGDWGNLPPPGAWMLYTYWHAMKPDGRGDYWGNNFPMPEARIEKGRWYCVELMMKANSAPDRADGEQALWVDGKLAGHFKGFQWRTSDELKLNSFWLLHDKDTHENNRDREHAQRIYDVTFDDVVVATEYIGPITTKGVR